MKKILFYIVLIASFVFSFLNAKNAFSQKLISKHTYTISKGNIEFATTINSLYQTNDKLIFEVYTSTSGIFKLKKDVRKERSIFDILDNQIVSKKYTFSRQKKDGYEEYLTKISRDSSKNSSTLIEKNDKKETIDHPYIENVQDRLSVQLDYKNKLKIGQYAQVYTVLDKGRVREYTYSVESLDTINTIFGETKCIVVRRVIKDNKRSTLTWYAIDEGFIPVIIKQYRKKNLQFTAELDNTED
tara:strand:+ start:1003 stop:1731 length:729 start_codon:yes stop_codon:yes gene_type:complete